MEQPPRQERKESFDVEKSPLKGVYLLLNAHTPLELNTLYVDEDQKLMKSGAWDYKNPDLITNKVKESIEQVGLEALIEDEKDWAQEILWFWYHHAISSAIEHYKDREIAQLFAQKALEVQPVDHPNKITQLLAFLVNNNLEDAKKWAEGVTEEPEKSTAQDLIGWFEEGRFF